MREKQGFKRGRLCLYFLTLMCTEYSDEKWYFDMMNYINKSVTWRLLPGDDCADPAEA